MLNGFGDPAGIDRLRQGWARSAKEHWAGAGDASCGGGLGARGGRFPLADVVKRKSGPGAGSLQGAAEYRAPSCPVPNVAGVEHVGVGVMASSVQVESQGPTGPPSTANEVLASSNLTTGRPSQLMNVGVGIGSLTW